MDLSIPEYITTVGNHMGHFQVNQSVPSSEPFRTDS